MRLERLIHEFTGEPYLVNGSDAFLFVPVEEEHVGTFSWEEAAAIARESPGILRSQREHRGQG